MKTTRPFEVIRFKGGVQAAYCSVLWTPEQNVPWGIAYEDDDVSVVIYDTKPGDKLAAKFKDLKVVSEFGFDPWVMHRSLAEPLFEGVPDVALRRVRVMHRGKVVPSDHVYIDVQMDRPLDRDLAVADYANPAHPWTTVVKKLNDAQIMTLPSDDLVVTRITEFPQFLLVSAPLVARWKKLKAPIQVMEAPAYALSAQPVFPLWDEGPAFPAIDVPAAVAAFRRVLAGDLSARAEAITHPNFAYAVARLIDKHPSDDTRNAALLHPHAATLYACFVDKGPRDDTREAAAKIEPTARVYAYFVDKCLTPPLRKTLLANDWDEASVKELETDLVNAAAKVPKE